MLGAAIEKSGADLLEVGGLLVSEPLLEEHRGLRNGAEVRPPQATGFAEGMAAGHGPYCQLAAPGRLQIESGRDGAVHLPAFDVPGSTRDVPAGPGRCPAVGLSRTRTHRGPHARAIPPTWSVIGSHDSPSGFTA